MTIRWITASGNLGIVPERIILEIPLEAESSNQESVSYQLIAGSLPRGLRLDGNKIKGSPNEVRRKTLSRFVIRANDGFDIEDRTFSITVDGEDIPEWITPEGFLNLARPWNNRGTWNSSTLYREDDAVNYQNKLYICIRQNQNQIPGESIFWVEGPRETYFVLDDAYVDFQLEAYDPDLNAGDNLEFYLVESAGELPPGLHLSSNGRISGFTSPVPAVDFFKSGSGAYDTQAYDILPLDRLNQRASGFDDYFYDNTTYDYSESAVPPRRISRFYTFTVGVTDGIHDVRRIFRIYVVTEEFLKADNSITQVDTNIFQADSSGRRIPIWITDSELGRYRANNYLTIYLDVYDPPTLPGAITYFLLNENPDGSPSSIPPGMELDNITGEIAGRVPYQPAISRSYQFTMQAVKMPPVLLKEQYTLKGNWNSSNDYSVNDIVKYLNNLFVAIKDNRNTIPTNTGSWAEVSSSAEKTFSIEIIGEIDSSIEWITDRNLGIIRPNLPCTMKLEAKSLLYGGRTSYELVEGNLPPGLTLISTGLIQGKVNQFSDLNSDGLLRFFDDEEGEISYPTFDGNSTSFDREFKFKIKARDGANFAESVREFTITVKDDDPRTYANLYLKAFPSKQKRLDWYGFITNFDIFRQEEIYRYGDKNFGIQSEIKALLYAGIESVEAVKFVQAMSRNHYRKRIRFGDVKFAQAKDPATQEPQYEVVYVEIVDEYEKNGKSINKEIELPDYINSPVLVSYDAIKVDSDVPLVSDRDHQRIFPNSFKNMRSRIKSVGERDREFLPLWMRSIQDNNFVEPGYVKALILCYVKPGKSESIISRIKASDFDFKSIDFESDRYVIDILGGQIEDKYLAFPQTGEKLP